MPGRPDVAALLAHALSMCLKLVPTLVSRPTLPASWG